MIYPTVAIVGAPNVGKSALFNRLVGERLSIVDDVPGLTRDRLYGRVTWLTKAFRLIDTGGIELENKPYQTEIKAQVQIAMQEADVIIFLLDARLGLTNNDLVIARMLRKIKKPILLAVNKVDDQTMIGFTSEFYQLGLGDKLFPLSVIHGIGVGDLLDEVITLLPPQVEMEDSSTIPFALIGRPNVGKSSLVNAILNEERAIISEIEGTTRDAVDTPFTYNEQAYLIIDTAGLKKRGKIFEAIDKYAALRALKAIDRSEIVLVVIDGSAGITEQDKHIAGYAFEEKKAIIIVVNKWDLVIKDQNTMKELKTKIEKEFAFISYAPIVFVSAKNKTRIEKIFEAITLLHLGFTLQVGTSPLNDVLQEAQIMNPSPHFNGGRLKIYYANQVSEKPPTFVLFVNNPQFLHFSYYRYLENRLRESFPLAGSPIKLIVRERK